MSNPEEDIVVGPVDETVDAPSETPAEVATEVNELSDFVAAAGEEVTDTKKKRGRKKGEPKEPKAPKEPKEKKERESKPRRDNLAYVTGLESISGVRKFIQTAKAKKAKTSTEKFEVQARYDQEVVAGNDHLANLLSRVEDASDKVSVLIQLDEEPNRIITAVIKDIETDFAGLVESLGAKEPPKSLLKKISDSLGSLFIGRFGVNACDFEEGIQKRYDSSDFRLKAASRLVNFMEMYNNGEITYSDGKWLLISDTTPTAVPEPAAE